jgi:thiol-disulfide isomerase/thioredoxin
MKRVIIVWIFISTLLGCNRNGQKNNNYSAYLINQTLTSEAKDTYRKEIISLENTYELKYKNFYNLPHFVSYLDSTKTFKSDELKAFFISDLIQNPKSWNNHNYQIEKTILRDIREEFQQKHPKSNFQPIVNKAIAKHYISNTSYDIPFFKAENSNQEEMLLSDFKDKVVVLDFWATWCNPCISQKPYLEKIASELKNEDVVFIKISLDNNVEKWERSVSNKIDSNTMEWHIPNEDIDQTKSKLSITSLPKYMMLDFKNKVVVDKMPKPESPVFKEIIYEIIKGDVADSM